MASYLFDCETDGLLDELTKIHSLVLKDIHTKKRYSFRNDGHPDNLARMEEGVRMLMDADVRVAHNGISFDDKAIAKVYPWYKPRGKIRDTLVLTRVLWPDIEAGDYARARAKKMPAQMIGRHSLEAWGYRLGLHKGDYKVWCEDNGLDPWSEWRQEMQDYCELDVEVLDELWKRCEKRLAECDLPIVDGAPGQDMVDLEHDVAGIICEQEAYGFMFDSQGAGVLCAELQGRRVELEVELKVAFPAWEVRTTFVPKVNNKARGYVKGVPFVKVKTVEFNPGSRKMVAARLIAQRGWEPSEFTKDGTPKVDEDTLMGLEWPEAKLLVEYFVVQKTLGMLAEGKQAWMKLVRKDGRIHGRVNSNGAVTGRMTHNGPNVAQTPSGKVAYGLRCRALFVVPKGKKLIGCDADALELRDLAGYMARYDGGAYIDVVLNGDKKAGTDMHSVNCRALGLDPKGLTGQGEETWRDVAKVFFYAWAYGAGDEKLGFILKVKGKAAHRADGSVWYPAAARRGKKARSDFEKSLRALGMLVQAVKAKAKAQRWIKGLDGRRLNVRSEHAALNTLLQSAGAIQMKRALVIAVRSLAQKGLTLGREYCFVANIHDEWQVEADEAYGTVIGEVLANSIKEAGEYYSFKCPLAGNYDIGNSWSDTH